MSSIFEPIRDFVAGKSDFFGELINCPMCSGFWVGLTVCSLDFQNYNPIYAGAITSMMSWIIASFIYYINSVTLVMETSIEEEE